MTKQQLHLSPVKNEFFLEGKTHGLVIFPSMPEDDHELDENPPTLQGILVVLQNHMVLHCRRTNMGKVNSKMKHLNVNHTLNGLYDPINGYKLPLAHVDVHPA